MNDEKLTWLGDIPGDDVGRAKLAKDIVAFIKDALNAPDSPERRKYLEERARMPPPTQLQRR